MRSERVVLYRIVCKDPSVVRVEIGLRKSDKLDHDMDIRCGDRRLFRLVGNRWGNEGRVVSGLIDAAHGNGSADNYLLFIYSSFLTAVFAPFHMP